MTSVPPNDDRAPDDAPEPSPRTMTTAESRDAILAAMPKEDFDAFAASLARLLLSADRAEAARRLAAEQCEGER